MARKKREESNTYATPLWMTTYSDMVTLLLCFFVLLFSFSHIEQEKYEAVAESLRMAFSGLPNILSGGKTLDGARVSVADPIPQEFRHVRDQIQELLVREGLTGQAEIYMEERGMVVSFKEGLLFAIGSADLKTEAKKLLQEVGRILARDKHFIRVEGHTCDLPIRNAKYPSNWELSTSRATNVTRHLIEQVGLDPRRLAATGYAEFRPRVPNTSEENRVKNRRVDLLLLFSDNPFSNKMAE
ncbi:MAG TPA: flagellar motor protein MotB [Bacillota bacterium]